MLPATPIIEHYTYNDYCQWQGQWELIQGFPVAMVPSPTIGHQAIAANILFELKNSIGRCKRCLVLCEQDWKLTDDTVLKPDVVLICDEPNDKYISKTPEIVVEIISPSTAKRDETFKFDLYQAEQVPYYLIVYPDENKAKLYQLNNGHYVKQGDFFKQTYVFDNTTCKAIINFNNVFKQFRNK